MRSFIYSILLLLIILVLSDCKEKEYVSERIFAQVDSSYVTDLRVMSEMVGIDSISPYDDIFEKYACELGWDWRLLAALSWCESHFNPLAQSGVGAKGLMQMMPVTAERFGLCSNTIEDPEESIRAGVSYLKYLNRMFRMIEEAERVKFILASYNSGPGHVLDAMALANKYNHNSNLWDCHVEKYLMFKQSKSYYKDPVCKYGRFRAKHTMKYIDDVYDKYAEFCGVEKNRI